jgi:hypothetical protein
MTVIELKNMLDIILDQDREVILRHVNNNFDVIDIQFEEGNKVVLELQRRVIT